MSESRRVQRVEKELREIIASYVLRNNPGGLLSISGVRVSKDMRQAKVYVSLIGAEKVPAEQIEDLQEQSKEIQFQIGKQLRMKYCPRLKFYNDDSVAMATKVDQILSQIDDPSSEDA